MYHPHGNESVLRPHSTNICRDTYLSTSHLAQLILNAVREDSLLLAKSIERRVRGARPETLTAQPITSDLVTSNTVSTLDTGFAV